MLKNTKRITVVTVGNGLHAPIGKGRIVATYGNVTLTILKMAIVVVIIILNGPFKLVTWHVL